MPTIENGSKHMQAVLYTGTGATQTIGGLNFQPDLIWIKSRSAATDHKLIDSVRGVTKSLESNTTDAEATDTNGVTAITSTGFTLGSDSVYNNSGATYVAWCWKANGAGSSNTAGSITSTVSANTSAGFSVVTYTGTGANATFGHGLGVAPSMVIVRNRSITQNFIIGHTSVWDSNLNSFLLFTSSATSTNSAIWNGARPTSSVISIGSDSGTNGNGNAHVAYCWSEVAGFSKFGIFTGNGSTDNAFVYTGFRPKFVMIKATTGTDNWFTLDSTRNTFNVANSWLSPNLANAEGADNFFDLLSNGFKMRLAGNTPYIYAAFAESPFKYANAR